MARAADVTGMSLHDLERVLAKKRSEINRLLRRRARLEQRIAELDERLGELGGVNGTGKGGRARNDRSLNDVVEEVLRGSGKPMRVADIADSVRAKGYRSNSANFRGIVNQALIKDKRFAAPSRGLYQLKK